MHFSAQRPHQPTPKAVGWMRLLDFHSKNFVLRLCIIQVIFWPEKINDSFSKRSMQANENFKLL